MQYEVIQPSRPYTIDPSINQIEASYCDKGTNDAKHYLMWSGGTDSSLLLYELLQTYGPSNIYTVSYRYPWLISDKWESEKAHRTAFMAKMHLRGLGGWTHTEITQTNETLSGIIMNTSKGSGLPQAIAWLLSVPIYAPDGSFIYDGGIRNDDLTLRLEPYHQILRGISGVMEKHLTFRSPYLYLTKANILEKLITYDLYEETWFCEQPIEPNVACHCCVPCQTHMAALNELVIMHKSDYIGVQAKRYLDRMANRVIDMSKVSDEPADKDCNKVRL